MNRRRLLLAIGASASVATAGCSTVFDRGSSGSIGERDATPYTDGTEHWPRDGFDTANTGYNPDVSLLTSEFDATRISQDGDVIDGWGAGAAVAVAGDRLYFGTAAGDVVCYTAGGTRLWSYEADRAAGVHSVPSLTRDVVYVTSDNGTYALDAEDGEELWTRDAWIRWGSSIVADGRVYAIESPGVVALDAETGEQRWAADAHRADALAVADGHVYVTGTDSDGAVVSAIDAGEIQWERTAASKTFVPPVVADDLVLVCTKRGRLLAFDREDGDTVWAFSRGASASTRPAVAHGNVYLPAGNGNRTRCLDLASGEEQWTVRTDLYTAQPTAVEDGVYFGTPNEGLFAVEPEGTVRWQDERWGVGGPVTAAGDRLYVSAGAGPFSAGNVHVLEP